jgi:transcriptional regulator with XRE-family HTH domain
MKDRLERAARLRPLILSLLKANSLESTAELLGVSIGAIRNIRDGKAPQAATIRKIENALGSEGSSPTDVRETSRADELNGAVPEEPADLFRLMQMLDQELAIQRDRAAAERDNAAAARLRAAAIERLSRRFGDEDGEDGRRLTVVNHGGG